jgi:hypothetical protein
MRIVRAVVVCGMLAIACSKDRISEPADSHSAGIIELEQGDGQFGDPNNPLRQSIVIAIVDELGAPVSGVDVNWEPQDGGTADPVSARTGADGRASTRWTLGPDTTTHIVVARADGYEPLSISAVSGLPAPPIGEIRLIELSTYEGTNQTVHPDFATAGDDWPAPRRYLAITPYPHSNRFAENPSFYEAFRSVRWSVPPGAANPLDLVPAPSHLSDPDIVFDPDRREFRMYYREVGAENLIWLKRTSDAVNWSERTLVVRGYNHEVVSPTVVRRSATDWLMWSVNGNLGCPGSTTGVDLRRSTDGVTWTPPERTTLSRPGMYAWHMDVQWMGDLGEYWAVFNQKPDTTCNTPALYLSTSRDGLTWNTYPTPLLERGAIPEFEDIVYRSTFSYNPANGVVTFWYSGARHDGIEYVWRTAVQRRLRSDVIADVSRLMAPRLSIARKVPPLRDFP